jgi:ribulose-phosphate 3-epimerase
MDGHFVDNISFGPGFVDAAAAVARVPVDTHLMISRPDHYLTRFLKSSHNITIHVEADCNVAETLQAIRNNGRSCGLSLRPGTPFSAVEPHLGAVDLVLVMTVEPGFGGQAFQTEMVEKIKKAAQFRSEKNLSYRIQVDGGITVSTAGQCIQAHGH